MDIRKAITHQGQKRTNLRRTANDTSAATLQASPAGVQAFVQAAYGRSMHWGLYSVLGRNEWAMHLESIPHARYFELTQIERFNAAIPKEPLE